MKKRVLVCMSGGVDSSTSTAILQKKGFEVTGVTMEMHNKNLNAINDAKKICEFLGIQHIVLNYKEIFYEKVIKNFVNEYLFGRTPNPCVVCNRFIKFGKIFDFAMCSGFDFIATGHYARIDFHEKLQRFLLKRAKSKEKDQSYFLYRLNQNVLSKTIFPLGNLEKSETRELAKNFGLFVSEKPESQDICFLENENYEKFIKKVSNSVPKEGNFVDESGKILGTHKGIIYYTIGQRKKLGIGFGKRMYVKQINAETNDVVLCDEDSLFSKTATVTDLNFIKIDNLKGEMKALVKIRSNSPCVEATISPSESDNVLVRFRFPQRAISPGQSAVFYDENGFVIGGGTIKS